MPPTNFIAEFEASPLAGLDVVVKLALDAGELCVEADGHGVRLRYQVICTVQFGRVFTAESTWGKGVVVVVMMMAMMVTVMVMTNKMMNNIGYNGRLITIFYYLVFF